MEAKHHKRYGRGQKTVEATHITSNPSGKLGTLKEEDEDDDDKNFITINTSKNSKLPYELLYFMIVYISFDFPLHTK